MLNAARKAVASRYSHWWSRIPEQAFRELLEIKQSLAAGEAGVSARALAAAIVADYESRGIAPPCSQQTLASWLNEK